ncbi:TPA: hypothetical protein ACFI5W_002093, partial [Neisseria gonorrhoeae]
PTAAKPQTWRFFCCPMILNRVKCIYDYFQQGGRMNPTKQSKKSYESKRVLKHVSFNTEKEAKLLEFSNNLDFSKWVKEKLKHELELEKLKK